MPNLQAAIGVEQIPKLFQPGRSLDPRIRELFHGREDTMRKIKTSFSEGRQSERYFLDGIRRVGKTTVLNFLPESLPDWVVPVDLNMDKFDIEVAESPRILQRFCESISSALAKRSVSVAAPAAADFQTDATAALRKFLDTVKVALPQRSLLLMVDEFQALLKLFSRTGSERGTLALDRLRALMEDGDILAIFTGSTRFDSLADIFDHRILGSLTPLRVSFLTEDGVGRVLRAGMERWVTIPSETVAAVYDQTGGYPWHVQIYGSNLIDLANREQRTILTPGDVDVVTREAVLPTDLYFRWWWASDQLGRPEEEFIERLFSQYPDAESVPMPEFFNGIQFTFRPKFERAFRNLRACEILDSTQSDVIKIRAAVLRRWLKSHMIDGQLKLPQAQVDDSESRGATGIFVDHENFMATLEEIAQRRGVAVPAPGRRANWLSKILENLLGEVARRFGPPEYKVAVAFWNRPNESALQTAYHEHSFDIRQPENVNKGNEVDFKLADEIRVKGRLAEKLGGRLDQVIIVSGDGDYSHLVRALGSEGVRVQIWAGRANVSAGYKDLIGKENVIRIEDVCGM